MKISVISIKSYKILHGLSEFRRKNSTLIPAQEMASPLLLIFSTCITYIRDKTLRIHCAD